MPIFTIPKEISRQGELVVISKKELNKLIAQASDVVGEAQVLRWSREARQLKRAGKLSVLTSLRAL